MLRYEIRLQAIYIEAKRIHWVGEAECHRTTYEKPEESTARGSIEPA
ncbi:hypothetical protein MICAB_2600001 [Microcystis aeruginosa PCC 9717]|uniref:Uncharacterized protein n=1 Tax=Microcystis aeruginosa PCC 9717 TaxID=1160286 RepID=I4FMB8_MICAE|nr:hypothetical protein MICAB_2600001 [Microcystis aeruginosa PCC 9717]